MAKPDPRGEPRGTRTAAILFAEAKKAAMRGMEQEAIDWILLCQSHNEAAQKNVRVEQDAVLDYLRRQIRVEMRLPR